jgi:ABC-2 type transport system ATP-binding protein
MDEAVRGSDSLASFSGETLLAVRGISKRYGARVAIENLELVVSAGEVFGLVGANGGGKTTTLRILAGILRPDQGSGLALGFDLIHRAKEIRRHIGYMSQRLSLYGDLSVFENLRFRAEVYGLDNSRSAAEKAIEEFELQRYARSRAGELSGGWARRLQLAAALIHAPRLILLDEPTAGLDVVSRHDVWRRIGQMAASGAAVVIGTHDLAEAELCASAVLLSEGRVVARGTPEQIARGAPAAAFLLAGAETRTLQESIEGMGGVLASYPQSESLRVVASSQAAEVLAHTAEVKGLKLSRVAMRLEDAVLAYSRASQCREV